ncbi:MAG: hypothetical protein M3Y45_05395, partial [Actinomycetota bacterium]|nr:hypothetical protein [Actinomycetota bacterium]
ANDADETAITALVSELNRVTSERDAGGFCDVMQPSSLESVFNNRARCIKETKAILEQAGEQPTLEVDSIEVDGNQALVKFTGRNGEAHLIKEGDDWFVPLPTDEAASAGTGDDSGEDTTEESTDDSSSGDGS